MWSAAAAVAIHGKCLSYVVAVDDLCMCDSQVSILTEDGSVSECTVNSDTVGGVCGGGGVVGGG